MFDESCSVASPVIGFAADGYPIYGSCFDDNGTIRKATSSYEYVSSRTATPADGSAIPDVNDPNYPIGIFTNDYQYNAGLDHDLDECNGMSVGGQYGYYVTDNYPWVIMCFKGTHTHHSTNNPRLQKQSIFNIK